MKPYMKTILNAVMVWAESKHSELTALVNNKHNALVAWIKSEYRKATDEEIIDLLAQEDALAAVTDGDGSILTTEGDIIIW